MLAELLSFTGAADRAIPMFDEALARLRKVFGGAVTSWVQVRIGLAYLRAGDMAGAQAAILDGIRGLRRTALVRHEPEALRIAAEWIGRAGHPHLAVPLWTAEETAWMRSGVVVQTYDRSWVDAGRARDRAALRADEWNAASASGTASDLEYALWEAERDLEAVGASDLEAAIVPSYVRLGLTRRGMEVLDLLVDGRSDGEIAYALGISPKTASVHVANIRGKLGADSRVETVTTALRFGLASLKSGPGEERG